MYRHYTTSGPDECIAALSRVTKYYSLYELLKKRMRFLQMSGESKLHSHELLPIAMFKEGVEFQQ